MPLLMGMLKNFDVRWPQVPTRIFFDPIMGERRYKTPLYTLTLRRSPFSYRRERM